MHARRSVRLPRRGMHGPDPLQQRLIRLRMSGRRPLEPSVVATLRDVEHARHDGDREGGLVRLHEPEDPDGTVPVSRANQAAARERMSRSCRNCLFSRRRRLSSSRSATDSPGNVSSRRTSCRSTRATQFRIAWEDGSNSRARSAGSRPARTSSTLWRRNSGEYGTCVLAMEITSCESLKGSTEAGQLHTSGWTLGGPNHNPACWRVQGSEGWNPSWEHGVFQPRFRSVTHPP